MLNFERVLNFKIISLTVAIVLFFTSAGYGVRDTFRSPIGDTFLRKVSPTRGAHLRVPMGGSKETPHIPERNYTVNLLLKEMLEKDPEKDREVIERIMLAIFGMEMDRRLRLKKAKKALEALIEDVSRAGEKRVGFLRIMLGLAQRDADALLRKKLGNAYKEIANILITDVYVTSDRFLVYGPDARRRKLGTACKNKDADGIKKVISGQMNRGAEYILINVDGMEGYYGSIDDVIEAMRWIISVVEEMDVPISIGSANIRVLIEGIKASTGKVPIIINSVPPTLSIIKEILPFIREYKDAGHEISVILAGAGESDTEKMITAYDQPKEKAIRVKLAFARTGIKLLSTVLSHDEIIFDPSMAGLIKQFEEGEEEFLFTVAFNTMRRIKDMYPDLHITAGVNNISVGRPNLSLLHRTFIAMGMASGMDAPILNAIDIQCMATIEAAKLLMRDWGMVEAELQRTNSIPLRNEFLDYFIEKFDPELKAEFQARGYSMYYLFNRTLIPLCFMLRGFRRTERGVYELVPIEEIWHPQVDEYDEDLQIVLRVVLLMLGDKNYEFYNKRKGVMSREPEHIRPYIEHAKKEDILEKLEVVRDMFEEGMLLEEEIVFLRIFLASLIKKGEDNDEVLSYVRVFLEKINTIYPVQIAVGDYIRSRKNKMENFL